MKTLKSVLIPWLLLIIPSVVMAHPGHGNHAHGGFSVIHYFTEPEHVLVIIGILLTTYVAFSIKGITPVKILKHICMSFLL